jgi:hypothetical protein
MLSFEKSCPLATAAVPADTISELDDFRMTTSKSCEVRQPPRRKRDVQNGELAGETRERNVSDLERVGNARHKIAGSVDLFKVNHSNAPEKTRTSDLRIRSYITFEQYQYLQHRTSDTRGQIATKTAHFGTLWHPAYRCAWRPLQKTSALTFNSSANPAR